MRYPKSCWRYENYRFLKHSPKLVTIKPHCILLEVASNFRSNEPTRIVNYTIR